MDLKESLKTIKMNESKISAIVGGIIIIVIGVMVFNYFKNLRPGSTTPVSISTESTQSPTPSNNYVVQKGDSLWSIAQAKLGSGFKWTEIAKANNLLDTSGIKEGQSLIIPSISNPKPSQIAQASASPTNIKASPTPGSTIRPTIAPVNPSTTPTKDSTTYTVVKGDNLWEIAEKAYGDGFKWSEIAKTNDLKNPRVIHSGNVLILPR